MNESGLDFQVAHAEDAQNVKWILRFPRRKKVITKTLLEKKVLDKVRHLVTFEVPVWSVYTDELIAYKQLSGVPTATVEPSIQNYVWEFNEKNVPDSYHLSLGQVLAELHRIPKSQLNLPGLTVHTAKESKAFMVKRMNAVKKMYGVGDSLWERWQTWLANDKMWPKETGFIHGDIQAGHTLMNKHAEVTGLIDWTEAAVTDVSKDFVGHYMTFGEKALECLINSYQSAGGNTWPLMKEHIIELTTTSAIDLVEFAEQSGSKKYEEMAKEALGV